MSAVASDKVFAGSIPKLYETHLVPLIFEPYAADLAARLRGRPINDLLELAAGTGVVTRALTIALPTTVRITATDLNPAMLAEASHVPVARPVTWQQADALALPFADASFDVVACQFGAMFFPDKAKAYAEARRVLRPGGVFIFNVWDRLADNEFPDLIEQALAQFFPKDPPRFLSRTPYAYNDPAVLKRDLAAGGFTSGVQIDTVAARSRADSARGPAIGFCQGTPLRSEIEARDAAKLEAATSAAADGIAKKFGKGPVDAKIQAVVVTARR